MAVLNHRQPITDLSAEAIAASTLTGKNSRLMTAGGLSVPIESDAWLSLAHRQGVNPNRWGENPVLDLPSANRWKTTPSLRSGIGFAAPDGTLRAMPKSYKLRSEAGTALLALDNEAERFGQAPIHRLETHGALRNLLIGDGVAPVVEPPLQKGDIDFWKRPGDSISGSSALQKIRNNRSAIEETAIDFDVDPDLIRAIIYEEQSHKPPIIEHPLAERLGLGSTVGLGQITEGYYGPSRDDLFDPKTNIHAIGRHLHELKQDTNFRQGMPVSSLASLYNCGSCNDITGYGRRVAYYYRMQKNGYGLK